MITFKLYHRHFDPTYDNTSVQFSSVAQSCPTLYDPMNCSTPGRPVHHKLPEFTQTHAHQDGDAIQPSHPLLPPSPPAPNPSQHQIQAHPILSILHPITEILADSIHLSNTNYIPCLQSLSYIV